MGGLATLMVAAVISVALIASTFRWARPETNVGTYTQRLLALPTGAFALGMVLEAISPGGHPSIGSLIWVLAGYVMLVVSPVVLIALGVAAAKAEANRYLMTALALFATLNIVLMPALPIWH
jgi:hypothetical protein